MPSASHQYSRKHTSALAAIPAAVIIALTVTDGVAATGDAYPALTAAIPDTSAPSVYRGQDSVHREIEQLYAKYLSGGRGNAEMHLSAGGGASGAQTRVNRDGSFGCRVFGLHSADKASGPSSTPSLRAGVFVHEVTHCQVDPYAPDLVIDSGDPVTTASNDLISLTLESVADTRAVIELFRRDGARVAREFVAAMLPQREKPTEIGHATSRALVRALAVVESNPAEVKTDEQAFGVAVGIGLSAARLTLQDVLTATGRTEVTTSFALNDTSVALADAMARAVKAFHAGRYANNAATIRMSHSVASEGDYHFFVSRTRSIRIQPCISAEGAHSVEALKALMPASVAYEHVLAIRWLKKQGLLDTFSVAPVRNAFAFLIKDNSDGSNTQVARAVAAIERAIDEAKQGEDFEMTLERAEESLARDKSYR